MEPVDPEGAPSDFAALTHQQRAHRSFRPDPLPDELVERLLDAAVRAPSAENSQPWIFVVVRDAGRRAALEGFGRAVWDAGARAREAELLEPALFADVDNSLHGPIAAAPLHVVVCGDTRRVPRAALQSSVFPAVQNLLLAATALGLGSALMTLPLARPGEVATLLGLPDEVLPLALVPLGWPGRPLGPNRRRPFAQTTHRETYGTGW